MKKTIITLIACLFYTSNIIWAQGPAGYYNSANGKTTTTLKTALYNIIKDHSPLSYAALWPTFQNTDKKADGRVWDMYSDKPSGTPAYEFTFIDDQCGNYNKEGVCYNREHSFPKSWFDNATPMYTDLFHLYPTDGYVNGKRGNYPFGEVGSASWTSTNGSKLGTNNTAGYTGTVFEPIDAYKGDFARSYFYMVTRYEDKVTGWADNAEAKPVLAGNKYPAFKEWAVNLLLKWHRNDPVSDKEVKRNNVIYTSYQQNRNPYIDHPELVEYIWGNKMGDTYYLSTGIESSNTGFHVYSSVGNIVVKAGYRIENISVYDVFGRIIASLSGNDYLTEIPVATGQLYIVKADTKVAKVYVAP
ncbi:HNH endonuclease signature motif containing protein [Viscerimonas tarda]